jgi:hypothetical protein
MHRPIPPHLTDSGEPAHTPGVVTASGRGTVVAITTEAPHPDAARAADPPHASRAASAIAIGAW